MPHVRLSDLSVSFDEGASLMVRSQAHGVAARVPPPAIAILAMCRRPTTREQVAAAMGPQMAGLFDGLVGAGLLVPPDQADGTPVFFHNFAGIEIHRRMLGDKARVSAYARAIQAAAGPGMTVLDAGTGSGLLACLAAKAGASRVYAVDNSEVLTLAQQTIAHNELGEVVQPVRGDFGKVQLPDKVDLIVSETFGAMALAEGSVPDLLACAQNNLKPGGRVLPDGLSLHLAPVRDPHLYSETLDPFGVLHGVDLGPLRRSAEARGRVVEVPAESLIAPGQAFVRLAYPSNDPAQGTVRFALAEGPLHGFVGWFDIFDAGELMLSTGPSAAPTHWRQTFLPLPSLHVPAGGAELTVEIALFPAADDRRSLEIEARWVLGEQQGSHSWRVR